MMIESQFIDITPEMMFKYYNRNTNINTNTNTNTNTNSRLSKYFNLDVDTYYCILFCIFMFPMIVFFISIVLSLTLR